MTLAEAAASLGTTPDTLRQAVNRRTLKAKRCPCGTSWLVTPRELERYRADHHVHARSGPRNR